MTAISGWWRSCRLFASAGYVLVSSGGTAEGKGYQADGDADAMRDSLSAGQHRDAGDLETVLAAMIGVRDGGVPPRWTHRPP